jgi:aspartokinase
MATVVVQKYGGSSVSDLEKIRRVAQRVQATVADGHRVVVVVSAMGNTTNELLQLARELTETPGRRELDMLISVGERITMALLSMAVNDLGIEAVSFTGSQSGIITDESHSAARIVAVRPHRIQAALDAQKVVIVAGFQGVSRDKEVTTLGRGGTDLTAVALAAALNASWCEICSDVDGIYTADPRTVPTAQRLDALSLDEALALARNGARVLQAEAVALAKRLGIELQASETWQREPGSRIQVPALPPRFTAVSVDSLLERFDDDDPRALVARLAAAGAPVHRVEGRSVWVDLRNWHDRASFNEQGVRLAEVAASAGEVRADPADVETALAALDAAGVSVERFSAGGDGVRVSVPLDHAQTAARALHDALVTPG